MHRHTVLFNLKESSNSEDVISKLRELEKLPTVEAMVIEKNIVPIGEHSPYEWCLVGDFKDLEARDSYEKHEIHVEIIKGTFLPNVKDFIMSDIHF